MTQQNRNIQAAFRIVVLSALIAYVGPPATARGDKPTQLEIGTQGDQLKFDHAELSAPAGGEVRLTFHNNAKPGSNLQHNWVLAKQGKNAEVAAQGIQAGASRGYVPDSPNVLAHTGLVDPGKSDSISFRAPPAKGDYPYLCTFPGHAEALKGVLHVK